jgi:threonine-phosphate decarboxylase
MIEGHGDDAWQYKTAIRADFSSNVLYGSLDAGLLAHLQEKVATVTHYPESTAQSAQMAFATAYGISEDQVLVTNGATEAIYLVAQTFRRMKATILTPSFAEYSDACRLHGLDSYLQPWDTVGPAARFPPGSLVFLCNPNNPTGSALSLESLQQLLNNHPESLFIIDESYIEFTRGTSSILPVLHLHQNALVLRSLTKTCRIPGLRIGFVAGHSNLVSQLRVGKMPWSVNRLAIEAANYIFTHRQQFTLPLDRLLATTNDWRISLQAATGWRIHDTDTHYFLMETPASFTAASLKGHLIERHGLLIRDAANFKGLTPYHFRVACQTPAHNQLLTEALCQCIRTGL